MGVIQFSVRAVGAVIFVLAVVAPIAVQLICQLDAAKWAVPANSVVGKTVIVTGGNSGLGFETARVLAQEGAQVVMACRSADKCKVAIDQIQQANPKANLKAQLLDLSDPNSVRNFAAEFLASHKKLDLLINNAAIMATEYATVQWPGGAVESQFATNHLGPYLLTGLLQNVLESTPGSRVINHSSSASDMTARVKDVHKIAQIAIGEYDAFGDQYTSSKRANRYFTWSLNQKLSGVLSVACHPGWTGTNLQHRATGVKASFMSNSVWEGLVATANAAYAQPPSLGAQPQLYAATAELKGDEVIGPRLYMIGTPVIETSEFCKLGASVAGYCAQEDLDALWEASERLSGFAYNPKSA